MVYAYSQSAYYSYSQSSYVVYSYSQSSYYGYSQSSYYGYSQSSYYIYSQSNYIVLPNTDVDANGSDGPISIPYAGSVTISWSSAAGTTCTASGAWSGSKPSSGSQIFSNLTNVGTNTYSLSGTSITGQTQSDSVAVNVLPPVPSVSNVITRVSNNTYCLSGVHATIEGTTSDPANSTITGYEVQIDDDTNPLTGSPEWQSGTVITSIPSGTLVSSSISGCSPSNPLCSMNWNRTYHSWMRVRNSYNQWSNWTQMNQFCNGASCNAATSWDTPRHAFPDVDFIYLPSNPTVNDPVEFTDQTTFAPSSNSRTWSWNFGGGIPGTATSQGPHNNTYTSTGTYNATLNVSDDAGACSISKPVDVERALPSWIEVPSR